MMYLPSIRKMKKLLFNGGDISEKRKKSNMTIGKALRSVSRVEIFRKVEFSELEFVLAMNPDERSFLVRVFIVRHARIFS